jgi:hypothetical protein
MKKHALIILVLLFFAPISSFSQNGATREEKPAKQINPGSGIHVKANTSEPGKQAGIKTESVFQLDENDPYQGRKDEFLAQIILKELPNDFPKYEKWMGVRHYNQIIDEYYKKHLDILIPVLREKLSSH